MLMSAILLGNPVKNIKNEMATYNIGPGKSQVNIRTKNDF